MSNLIYLTYICFSKILLVNEIKGVVVQLVRAPPCQGGSRGFKSRQSRSLHFFDYIIYTLTLLYCEHIREMYSIRYYLI